MAQDDARDSGVGLAEIVSAYFPVEQLARHLGDNASAPAAPIQLALGQVAAKLKDSGELHPGEQVRLIVVIDQLEELFTDPAITAAERERLVLMLASLARSGVVWVIATMRSDFWHRVAELPLLAELATGEGRLDLWPPNAAELTEIIRQPAAAAGLDFETDEQRMALDAHSGVCTARLLAAPTTWSGNYAGRASTTASWPGRCAGWSVSTRAQAAASSPALWRSPPFPRGRRTGDSSTRFCACGCLLRKAMRSRPACG